MLNAELSQVIARLGHTDKLTIAVTRSGAQPSAPWRAEIDEFLQQQG